jgi:hypothetical protein
VDEWTVRAPVVVPQLGIEGLYRQLPTPKLWVTAAVEEAEAEKLIRKSAS